MVNHSLNNASLLNNAVSTAIFILGLVLYGGEYWSLLPGPVAVLSTKSLVIPTRNLAAKKRKSKKNNKSHHHGHGRGDVLGTDEDNPCLVPPSGTAFSGVSDTPSNACQTNPFETCHQLGDESSYCWAKSYYYSGFGLLLGGYCPCNPNGVEWKGLDAKYVNPVTNPLSCGPPCTDMNPSSPCL